MTCSECTFGGHLAPKLIFSLSKSIIEFLHIQIICLCGVFHGNHDAYQYIQGNLKGAVGVGAIDLAETELLEVCYNKCPWKSHEKLIILDFVTLAIELSFYTHTGAGPPPWGSP